MNYDKIKLMQMERRDIPDLKGILNSYKIPLCEFKELNTSALNDTYDSSLFGKDGNYNFAIRATTEGAFLSTVGFCSIKCIDWVSRHCELYFIYATDDDPATIPNNDNAISAFRTLIDFAFNELNLQKVWISVPENNNIKGVLNSFGFVAEGVRRRSKLSKGDYIDETICSLLVQEYREREIK